MTLAIIIVNYNSYEVTKQTILSLGKTSYTDYDIILVDNASTDGSGEKLKTDFPAIHFIASSENKGFAGGNNLAIQFALENDYTYILLLNPDVEVEPDFLEPLINKLDAEPKIGAVQPLIYFHHDKERIWNAGASYHALWGNTPVIGYNQKDPGQSFRSIQRTIDWITGCAFMVKAEAIKKAGPLDETYFMYYEDADWSLAIKKAGYDLAYIPESVIYHIAGFSQKTKAGNISPNTHYNNIRSRIIFLKKHTPFVYLPTTLLYQSIYIILVSCYFLIRGRWSKWKAWNRGIWHGLITNTKL